MSINGPFLATEICCFPKLSEMEKEIMGKSEEDQEPVWKDIVLDLRNIMAVRDAGEDDGPIVTLYTGFDSFTVRGEYDEIFAYWTEIRGGWRN